MFKRNLERGFTLIELLVVIAIIGILAATVLASLGTARSSGSDASVKGSINSAKAQAELYYSSQATPTYDGVCAATTANNGLGSATGGLLAAIDNNVPTAGTPVIDGAVQTLTTINCNDVAGSWALSAPLSNGTYFCADSTGYSGVRTPGTTPLPVYSAAGSGTVCP
jgi:prepilin-type N-terminal cleavage/methylation domain-containing protein